MEAILKKDAVHPIPVEKTPTYKDIITSISDNILENKYKLMDSLDKILKHMMIKSLKKAMKTMKLFLILIVMLCQT